VQITCNRDFKPLIHNGMGLSVGRIAHPEPFLKKDEAEENFVIVLPAGGILLEEIA
jgi:hypothetical protein